mmetsp:Transcript_2713/g.7226  ORF Transcript_2713/g.7226 Transcript_2713/m.7226 type:complete len:587 (+) Transcript_2713:28419-30179(+)
MHCPICGSVLASESQQLRSDDEPCTLVRLCKVHGQVGLVISSYMKLSSLDSMRTNSFSNNTSPALMTDTVHVSCPLVHDATIYSHAYTKIEYLEQDGIGSECIYDTCISTSMLGHKPCMSTSYLHHPLWNTLYENSMCVNMIVLQQDIEWLYCNQVISLHESSIYASDRILQPRTIRVVYPSLVLNECTLIGLMNTTTNVVTIHCLAIGNRDFGLLHRNIREYITAFDSNAYRVVGCTTSKGWLKELRHLRRGSGKIRLNVRPDIVPESGNFKFVRATGHYGYLYVDEHYCLYSSVSGDRMQHLDPDHFSATRTHPCILEGYLDMKQSKFACSKVIRLPSTSGYAIQNITTIEDDIRGVAKTTDDRLVPWRECVNNTMKSIVLVSSRHSGIDDFNILEAENLNQRLLSQVIIECSSQLQTDYVLIYGNPSTSHMPIIRDYRCCFVYESDWEQEATESTWVFSTLKANSVQQGIVAADRMIPSRVERTSSKVCDYGGIVLGLDELDYSSLNPSGNYLIQVSNNFDLEKLPSVQFVGINRQYVMFNNGSLIGSLYNSLNNDVVKLDYNICCSRQLEPYLIHVYKGHIF